MGGPVGPPFHMGPGDIGPQSRSAAQRIAERRLPSSFACVRSSLAPAGRSGVSLVTAMSRARTGRLTLSPLSLLVLAALAAILLQGACLPHTHTGVGPGLYNQDHDLSLLATLHGAAVLHGIQTAPLVVFVVSALTPTGTGSPVAPARSTADSRAPPLA